MKTVIFASAMLFFSSIAFAQIPTEFFAGHKKATLDIMFFRNFKNKEGQISKFLFFNRNRASMDYTMTTNSGLPQLGFTEAISFNDKKFKGFAPVAVVQIFNKGIYPKAGVQYAQTRQNMTIFTWVVSEIMKNPHLDFFLLGRYTPKLIGNINLFTQIELVNVFPTVSENNFSFIQRFRLGLKISAFQFGTGMDFIQSGRNNFAKTNNIGGFLRYEF
jgi:hypothetical protein